MSFAAVIGSPKSTPVEHRLPRLMYPISSTVPRKTCKSPNTTRAYRQSYEGDGANLGLCNYLAKTRVSARARIGRMMLA
jgi:hypothetical protein